MKLTHLTNLVFDLLTPPSCLVCQHELTSGTQARLCHLCSREIAALPTLGRQVLYAPSAKFTTRHLDTFALWPYAGIAKEVIHKAKFTPSKTLLQLLGAKLGTHLAQIGNNQAWDMLVPIPSSQKYARQRLCESNDLLIRGLRRSWQRLNIPTAHLLTRKAASQPQSTCGAQQRLKNAHDSFFLNKAGLDISGQQILLVDDVSSTGASLFRCADLLAAQGAKSITGLLLSLNSDYHFEPLNSIPLS